MKYNRRNVMTKAHKLFRDGRYGTFANCLTLAWADEKAVVAVREQFGEVRTWFGWTTVGREVWHGEHAVVKVIVNDPTTKTGTRKLPFFTFEQTCELGEQPIKVC